jgi:hypothetical protein
MLWEHVAFFAESSVCWYRLVNEEGAYGDDGQMAPT